ncbi:MAG TPA: OmpA family protein, partial [Solirubrobacterales bacterium]|nr:OmpA family protein [Solirubrobacterales bacterium]
MPGPFKEKGKFLMRTWAKPVRTPLGFIVVAGCLALAGCGEESEVNPAPVVTRKVADVKPAQLPPLHFRELSSGDFAASLDSDVYFRFDSAGLTPKARIQLGQALLPEVRQFLFGGEGRVVLRGYTDGLGEADYNLDLSRERANSVASLLLTGGVDAADLRVEGHGEAS